MLGSMPIPPARATPVGGAIASVLKLGELEEDNDKPLNDCSET